MPATLILARSDTSLRTMDRYLTVGDLDLARQSLARSIRHLQTLAMRHPAESLAAYRRIALLESLSESL